MTGYLTKVDPDAEGDTVELTIPNVEISNIFEETVVRFFKDSLDRSKQKELMEAFRAECKDDCAQPEIKGFFDKIKDLFK